MENKSILHKLKNKLGTTMGKRIVAIVLTAAVAIWAAFRFGLGVLF